LAQAPGGQMQGAGFQECNMLSRYSSNNYSKEPAAKCEVIFAQPLRATNPGFSQSLPFRPIPVSDQSPYLYFLGSLNVTSPQGGFLEQNPAAPMESVELLDGRLFLAFLLAARLAVSYGF
jgi:hypothetical protein